MNQPSTKVTVAPWLSEWLQGYVRRCQALGQHPDFGLMRLMAKCATGVK